MGVSAPTSIWRCDPDRGDCRMSFIDHATWHGSWPQIHLLVFYVAMLAGICVGLATLVAQFLPRKAIWKHAFLPTAALAIASLVGGAMGVAAGHCSPSSPPTVFWARSTRSRWALRRGSSSRIRRS